MNDQLTTLPPPASLHTTHVLSHDGLNCALLFLNPGEESSSLAATSETSDQLLFVVDGTVTLRIEELNFVLKKDEAMHLSQEKEASLWNHGSSPAKLLRIEIPPRVVRQEPIFTFPQK